jgi:hypothetical protein
MAHLLCWRSQGSANAAPTPVLATQFEYRAWVKGDPLPTSWQPVPSSGEFTVDAAAKDGEWQVQARAGGAAGACCV